MLTRLHLENFQKHKSREILIGPGVTSIVGPTEAGKSAVLRALTWACRNQGAAGGFISHWATSTCVTVDVDDYSIARRRTSKGNHYKLTSTETGEILEEWSAVRSDVPARIAEILGTPEVCFQGQHDGPFWLGATAPEVGRAVNSVVDLGVIDAALTMVNGIAQKAAIAENLLSVQLKEANATLAGLAWVEAMGLRWDALVRDKLDLGDLVGIRDSLVGLIEKAAKATREARTATQRADAAASLLAKADEIRTITEKEKYLRKQYEESAGYKKSRLACETTKTLLAKARDLEKLERDRRELARNIAQLDGSAGKAGMLDRAIRLRELAGGLAALEQERRRLVNLLNQVAEYRRAEAKAKADADALEQEIADMPEDRPKLPELPQPQPKAGLCPTCGQRLPK